MHKISYISILGLIGSISLTSCSKSGGSSNPGTNNSAASSQPNDNNKHDVVPVPTESCEDLSKEEIKLANAEGQDGLNDVPKAVDPLKLTKVNLCKNIEENLNSTIANKDQPSLKPVNAFSSMWNANIQFVNNNTPGLSQESRPSFIQILADGTFVPMWGVKDWISPNGIIGEKVNKLFAFGEAPRLINAENEFEFKAGKEPVKKKWGVWDIRVVGDNGKVYVAQTNNNFTANYVEEADLGKEFVEKVFGAFSVAKPGENQENEIAKVGDKQEQPYVYFLKKDGTYEVKQFDFIDVKKEYKEISPGGKISDLFPMIPAVDIASIDYIQKLANNEIALFKKSKLGGRYEGYYLVSVADLNKKDAKVTFVTAKAKEIVKENCEEMAPSTDPFAVIKSSVCSIFKGNLAIEVGQPFLNAYSSQSSQSLVFKAKHNEFKKIDDKGVLSSVYLPSYANISNDLNDKDLKIAFGEVPNSIVADSSKPKSSKVWDIQYIDATGAIYKASSLNNKNANYVSITNVNLGQDYIKEVFGAFLLPEGINNPSYVYFLKKNGTYDVKDSANDAYTDVVSKDNAPRETADLFPMIPAAEMKSIDFVQKLPNKKIALFKKVDSKYVGYYIVSTEDVAKNNENGLATYVAFEKDKPVVEETPTQPIVTPPAAN